MTQLTPFNNIIGQLDWSSHCLGNSLLPYVASKVASDLTDQPWSRIVIRDIVDQELPEKSSMSRPKKKQHKLLNAYRPITWPKQSGDDNVLEIYCIPGRDYVEHYATLIALYYHLNKKKVPRLTVYQPSISRCYQFILDSNLKLMGTNDIILIGYVDQFTNLVRGTWQDGSNGSSGPFFWQQVQRSDGLRVAFLGCRFSFWGDISYHLANALHLHNRASSIIYIGKTGSLRPQDSPNDVIATGSASYLHDEKITWKNTLEQTILRLKIPEIEFGTHVTVGTPLQESRSWFSEWHNKSDWVDCEVGHLARCCRDNSMDFGYLHVVSDNIAKAYDENLANERIEPTPTKRRRLMLLIEKVLQSYLQLPLEIGDVDRQRDVT